MAVKDTIEVNDNLKLVFLEVLLEKREDIKCQFDEFIRSKSQKRSSVEPERDKKQLIDEIQALKKEYFNELEMIDLEEVDWENYVPRHNGYIPEYEAMEHMAEDMIDEIIDSWKTILLGYLDSGTGIDAIIHLIAQYYACTFAEIDDPCDTLGDPREYIIEQFAPMVEKLVPKFEQMIFSETQTALILQLFFEETKLIPDDFATFIHFFESLLLVFIDTDEKAKIADSLMKSYKISKGEIPRIVLQANKLLGEDRKWIEYAESYFSRDKYIAQELIDYYYNNQKTEDFLRVSKEVFKLFKNKFIDYFLGKINEHIDVDFYKDLLSTKVKDQNHFDSYKKLRPFLQDKEIDNLLDSLYSDAEIKIQILAYEKKYEEIHKIVVKYSDNWNFPMLIKPILNIFPQKCFSLIEKRCLKTLEHERGRDIYQKIVTWLQLAKTIKDYSKKTESLIGQLYNWKPRLPALRDEFKQGGLL